MLLKVADSVLCLRRRVEAMAGACPRTVVPRALLQMLQDGPTRTAGEGFRPRSARCGRRKCGGLNAPTGSVPRNGVSSDFPFESRPDVGLFEILPLEQERLAGDLGERIGEAVAEIQPGRVAALSEVEEGLASQMRLLGGKCFDDDVGSAEESVTLTAGFRPNLAFNDDGELEKVGGTDRQRSASWIRWV